MAKTRRKKINTRPTKLYRNSKVVVLETGMGVKVAGFRAEGKQVAAKGDAAKPIHIGRVYTGTPRGKTYPYGSARQGFKPKAAEQEAERGGLTLRKRRPVAVVG